MICWMSAGPQVTTLCLSFHCPCCDLRAPCWARKPLAAVMLVYHNTLAAPAGINLFCEVIMKFCE